MFLPFSRCSLQRFSTSNSSFSLGVAAGFSHFFGTGHLLLNTFQSPSAAVSVSMISLSPTGLIGPLRRGGCSRLQNSGSRCTMASTFADVAEEFVTQPLPFAGAFYEAGNINELDRSRHGAIGPPATSSLAIRLSGNVYQARCSVLSYKKR